MERYGNGMLKDSFHAGTLLYYEGLHFKQQCYVIGLAGGAGSISIFYFIFWWTFLRDGYYDSSLVIH
jgi:hypothetical protein